MKKKVLMISFITFIILTQIPQLVKGAEVAGDYKITDSYISRIYPETTVAEFKANLKASSIKVYKDSTKSQEITTGNIATNMCVEYEGKTRKLSVIGDLNNDGLSNQLDLSLMIRHILGFNDSQITDDMKKVSADVTGDGNVNNVDITAIIRYNIYGEFNITSAKPEITNMTLSPTANSIKVNVTANNAENGIYEYSYKKSGATEYIDTTRTKENSYTITGLEKNEKYKVTVKVTNKYGMSDTEEKETTTKSVLSITNQDGTKAITGNTTWSNGKATIDLNTNTEHEIEYQINGTTGEWKKGEKIQNLKSGDVVYIRLTNGTDNSEALSFTIEDKIPPTITEIKSSTTADSLMIEVIATDNQSGMPEQPNYVFYIKESTQPDSSYTKAQEGQKTSLSKEGLSANTTYTVKVEVEDKAGNKATYTKELKTSSGDSGTEDLESGNITATNLEWNNEMATITLSTQTQNEIEWQVNGINGAWTKGTTVSGLKHGDTVYVRLTNGTNVGQEGSIAIKDSITPEEANISFSKTKLSTEESVEATIILSDNQSGVDISSCKWVCNPYANKQLDETEYKETFTGGMQIISFNEEITRIASTETQNLTLNKDIPGRYYLHVLTVDKAGNKTQTVSNVVTITEEGAVPEISDIIGQAASTVNQTISDEYGNKVVIPAGFTIVPHGTSSVIYNYTGNNIPAVQDGIVVKDSDGNEFVWVPIGTINNKQGDTKGATTEMILGRYSFADDGTETLVQNSVDYKNTDESTKIQGEGQYQELETTSGTNAVAKNLGEFVTNTNINGGYYIARYEAVYRDGTKPYSKPSTGTPAANTSTTIRSGMLWNYVTQAKASTASKNMYNTSYLASDLINSYAWDTAIVFIQRYSTETAYSKQKSKNTTRGNTGERTDGSVDKACNIYDMAANEWEMTTETCLPSYVSLRGPCAAFPTFGTVDQRTFIATTHNNMNICFRPILYLKQSES